MEKMSTTQMARQDVKMTKPLTVVSLINNQINRVERQNGFIYG